MALTEENGNGFYMPVAPAYGGNNGMGFGGDSWAWIILHLLLGWGNNGFGGQNGQGGLYPWMNQANLTSEGFQNQLMNDNITSIRDGVHGISTQLCNGFADLEQSANARQMANMQTAFAGQTAMNQGFNSVQSQLAQCCCDNRMATADLKYTVATENCADRAALADSIRDVIANQTANTQRILDQLCNDKIDAKNEKIAELQNQLNMATLRESQTQQNAFIAQGLNNEVDQLYNRLSNCPVPTTPVYGRTPIFTCNNGCGCGCNN